MIATLVISGIVYATPYIIKDNKVIVQPSEYSVTVENNLIIVKAE